eukprot:263487_1
MLVVDRLTGDLHTHGTGHAHGRASSLALLEEEEKGLLSTSISASSDSDPLSISSTSKGKSKLKDSSRHFAKDSVKQARGTVNTRSFSATIGLMVHAAVDGLALGAASTNNSGQVEFIVFMALMMHKAPAAFALGSFLLDQGRPRREVTQHLVLFSAMAPILALVTFLALGDTVDSPSSSGNHLGLCLLFSAGTFLYVSTVHMIGELASHG